MAASNVTVLTSSTADKVSREDDNWRHGAFAKALLDALSARGSDTIRTVNGVISMTELSAYMRRHLSQLTDGDQQLGASDPERLSRSDIFVCRAVISQSHLGAMRPIQRDASSAKAKADDQHSLILRRIGWADFISIRCGAAAQDRREGA